MRVNFGMGRAVDTRSGSRRHWAEGQTAEGYQQQSSRDCDTVDLMKSKIVGLSQSTDRTALGFPQPEGQDELLNIIGNNLGDVSMQLRQSFPDENEQRLEYLEDYAGSGAKSRKNGFRDSAGSGGSAGGPAFEFKMIQMYSDWFEEEFIENTKDDNRNLVYLVTQIENEMTRTRVGALCQIYKLIYSGEIERPEDLKTVVYALVDYLKSGLHNKCAYSLFVSLEVIYFVGPDNSDEEFAGMLSEVITGFECLDVQRKAARVLFSMGTVGLKELLKISNSGAEESKMVVDILINEPVVIETILVPSLLNQFHSCDTKLHAKSTCALGKLGRISMRSDAVPLLSDMLLNSPVDKTMVISALRAMGERGEKELCKLYKKVKSPKVKASICFFLGQKVPVEFVDSIQIVSFE